jgi:hypothetical protein
MVVTRRRFLAGSAAVSLAAVLEGHAGAGRRLMATLAGDDLAAAPHANVVSPLAPITRTFSVERTADLVQLDVTFTGFSEKFIGTALSALQPLPGSFVTVQFPPQAIGEAAYPFTPPGDPFTPGGDWYVDPPPVLSAMSGPSRLCFSTVTDVTFSRPMSVTDLLDWSSWTLLVPDLKAGDPAGDLTCIEYPYALYLAPEALRSGEPNVAGGPVNTHGYATFAGRQEPLVSSANMSDCWTAAFQQTALGRSYDVGTSMAAVWAPDYATTQAYTPDDDMTITYGPKPASGTAARA